MSRPKVNELSVADFRDSFLLDIDYYDWPNECAFIVWAPREEACYRFIARTILEFHFMRTGTGRLEVGESGISLTNIRVSQESEYIYWADRISAFASQGYDSGEGPICINFESHLFANRKREMLTRDRNTGLLVVFRSLEIEKDDNYLGPRPSAFHIPSSD